jgi:hypothetical protein
VWDALADISSHVDWMEDAVAIRFTSGRRRHGVGTTFDCDTVVGPFRFVDHMEVVEWRPRKAMAIVHTGLVSGEGRFVLRRRLRGGTRFVWDERLRFPWWAGGPLAGLTAAPIVRRIWRRDLANLKRLVESRSS